MKKFCLIFLMLLSTSAFSQSNNSQKDSTYIIEINPEFPGGIKALYKYLGQNFNYPKSVIKACYSGRMIVKFIIEKDGRVKVDSIDHSQMFFRNKKANETLKELAVKELNASIINLYEYMPVWKPGTQNGEAVRVFYSLPYILECK